MALILDAEQLRVLRELDVDTVLERIDATTCGILEIDRTNALAFMHKRRLAAPAYFSPKELEASRAWLRARHLDERIRFVREVDWP